MVSLVAFYGGILNGFEHFFAPAFSTVLFNLAIIVSALLLSEKLGVEALAIGVVAGGILQLILQLIFLKRLKAIPRPILSLSEDVKKTLKNVIPGIFGFAVRQVSMLIDTVLASFLKAGAISYLYYANRFVQLPLGMFAIGLSQVLLPRLSKKIGEKGFNRDLKAGLTFCSAIVVPASVGLIFFGKAIIDLIFNHGAFSEEALNETYKVLIGYSLGLFFFSAEKILTNAFYSLDEYKLPVKISAYTLLFNLFINLILCFGFHLGVMGLAIGTSLTSALNVFALLSKFNHYDERKDFWKLPIKYTVLSLPIVITSLVGNQLYFKLNSFLAHVLTVTAVITISASLYFAILLLTKDRVISLISEE
jgi:putative peptidoglycan lipid II flippase